MAMTKDDAQRLYMDTYHMIASDAAHWKKFLNMSSNVYRYNFISKVMIYAQRPDATACASFQVWTDRMNRKIRYGAKGIALYDELHGTLSYVFDSSDTLILKNSRPMNNWEMKEEHQKRVTDRLADTAGIFLDYEDGFTENVIKTARHYAEEQYLELEEEYQREQHRLGETEEDIENERRRQLLFLTSSIGYSVLKRCGMSQELLDEKFHFDNMPENQEQFLALGDICSRVTDQLLQEVRDAVNEYDKETGRTGRYDTVRNGQPGSVLAGMGTSETGRGSGKVRDDASELAGGTQKDVFEQKAAGDVAHGASSGDTEPGGGSAGTTDFADENTGGNNRGSENRESTSLDSENGQHYSESRGDSDIPGDRELEAVNFHIPEDLTADYGSPKEKFKRNVEAIRILTTIENEKRHATPEEQEILSRYVGWGGLADAFDSSNADWAEEYAELKGILSEKEYRDARASTVNAFYTDPMIARCMYETLQNMGFSGGNLLEPSMGTGNFFGSMPPDLAQQSRLYGVELDNLSGRIAKALYPEADITIGGFEKTDFSNDFFDVVIGNVPFGENSVYDKDYKNQNFLIHDYFLAKSIDKVRAGGIVAVISSKGSMDKANESVRKYINERAELVGAVRLPNTAFKRNAGTDVTSDILFFKKREAPSYEDAEWLHTVTKPDGMVLNSYFDRHPEMVLGSMQMTSGRYGMVSTCVPDTETPLVDQLRTALSHIDARMERAELMTEYDGEQEIAPDVQTIPADPGVRNFSYTIKDDILYFRENSVMRTLNDQETRGKGAERIRGLLELRDITTELLNLQLDESVTDEQLAEKQGQLNSCYDKFVKKYGSVNSKANKAAFRGDSAYNLVCSLEKLDDEGNVESKADIFSRRTIGIKKEITHTDSSVDALAVSLADTGIVDIDRIARLTGKSGDEVINELYGVIFKDPANGRWQTSEEYLSGNVREKLRMAENAAQMDSIYQINVDALRKSMPQDLSSEDIDARLGSTWIDPEYIKDFMVEVLNTPRRNFEYGSMDVNFSEYGAVWSIRGKQNTYGNVKVREVFGVKDVIDAYQLLELSLNLKEPKIYKTEYEGITEKRVLDHDKTILAQQKQTELKEAFKEWIWKDFDRREKLVRKYNDLFNSTVPRHYDGSHIRMVGSNPCITLLQHQKNAVARILYGGNTLLAHCVGAGKTYTMIASAMEKKRLGLCHKNMITVPNHLTEQWGADFLKLYPGAKVLVATKKDFEPANRKRFCSRIATGDWDAVIIGHSQFEKIPLSAEKQQQMIERQIDDVAMAIDDARRGGDRLSVKQLEKTRKSLEKNLQELNDAKKDDVVTFEQLGIDSLYVDESHMFKNLYVYTKMSNVAGIQTTESKKATDMYNKCMYLDEITGGKGITFATGTPIANTMAELYTNMRYLQGDLLKRTGLSYFDAWASTFGETVTALEIKPEGNGFRTKTRFARFFNLPELINMWRESADIQTREMLPDLMAKLPQVEQHNIVLKPSEEQKMIVASLADRAEAVRSRQVKPDEDNMLKITNDGRKLALDQRLINPFLPDDNSSKVNACVEQAVRIWKETAPQRSAQVIFCDLSTPKAARKEDDAETAFSVYDDLKKKLIAQGVPADEIAFIHDANTEAKKTELFGKVNKGIVRFLLGSTEKMGAGTNIQHKLIALHHLDVPWRPADLEQQEGRIIRQGNENKKVHIFRYVKEDTFDGYSWQTIENKNRFITQIMTDKSPVRRAEDVDETVLDNATVKSLCVSDKRIKEKMDLDIEVQKLELLRSSHTAQIHQFERSIKVTLPASIEQEQNRIVGLKQDMEMISSQQTQLGEDGFRITVNGTVYTDKKEGAEAFLQALKESVKVGADKEIGEYMGFKIISMFDPGQQKLSVILEGSCRYMVEMGTDPGGCIQRMNHKLDSLENELEKADGLLEIYQKSLEEAQIEVLKPFPREEELITKKARLIELNAALNNDCGDRLTFYVAENMECDCVGKYREGIASLSEAKELFEQMPEGFGKGIGMKFRNTKYALLTESGDRYIDAESLFRTAELRDSADVRRAVREAVRLFPDARLEAGEQTRRALERKSENTVGR